MRKEELEECDGRYQAYLHQIEKERSCGRFREAIEAALNALPYVDGMMRYRQKWENEKFDNIDAIAFILEFAPLLLLPEPLDTLETVLKSARRIERDTTEDLAALLAKARRQLEICYLLWDLLEVRNTVWEAEVRLLLGNDGGNGREILARWQQMGFITQEGEGTSRQYSPVLKLERPTEGKCPACGAISRRPKRDLYGPVVCTGCRQTQSLVIMTE